MAWNAKVRYYAVHVSQSGRERWRWSEPKATAAEARETGRARMDSGDAVMFFVVRVEGDTREILMNRIEPAAARKAIERFEELLELIDGFEGPEPGGRGET